MYELQIVYSQGADRVENGYYHNADVCEYRDPHVGHTESDEQQAAEFDDQREADVLVYDADALAGYFDRLCDLERIVVHEHNVGSLDSGVGAHGAHRNADVRAAENRSASLMPSPTKASLALPLLAASSPSTFSTLPAGSSSLYTSSTPSSAATESATFFMSPVSITVFSTPACFRFAMACLECGLTISEMTM